MKVSRNMDKNEKKISTWSVLIFSRDLESHTFGKECALKKIEWFFYEMLYDKLITLFFDDISGECWEVWDLFDLKRP